MKNLALVLTTDGKGNSSVKTETTDKTEVK
jgi:hypothetical protein